MQKNKSMYLSNELFLSERICDGTLFSTEGPTTSPGTIETTTRQGDPVIIRIGLPYPCDVCGDTFAEKGILLHHRLTHTKKIIEACDTDNKLFSKKRVKFKRDVRVETPVCMTCNKTFSNWYLLRRHRDTHIDTRNYACDMCSKHFVSPRYLKEHFRRAHTGENPYKCDMCKESFSTKVILDRHRLLHKRFACSECDDTFSSECAFKVHRTIHTGKKLPKCGTCGKVFAHKSWLAKHMPTHTGKRPFKCGMCGKAFAQKGNLKVHLQSQH